MIQNRWRCAAQLIVSKVSRVGRGGAPGKNLARASVLHGRSCSTADECLHVGTYFNRLGNFAPLSERWVARSAHRGEPQTRRAAIGNHLSAERLCAASSACLATGGTATRPTSTRSAKSGLARLAHPGRQPPANLWGIADQYLVLPRVRAGSDPGSGLCRWWASCLRAVTVGVSRPAATWSAAPPGTW